MFVCVCMCVSMYVCIHSLQAQEKKLTPYVGLKKQQKKTHCVKFRTLLLQGKQNDWSQVAAQVAG